MRYVAAALLLSVAAGASTAHAYEDQLALGLSGGYAAAPSSRDVPTHAFLVDASASVGLSQSWALRLRAGYGAHPDARRPVHMVLPGAALLYLIDVLQWVPYFGLGAGALLRFTTDDSRVDAVASAVAGVDYLLSRLVTLELELRAHPVLSDLRDNPVLLSASAGVLFMFDA